MARNSHGSHSTRRISSSYSHAHSGLCAQPATRDRPEYMNERAARSCRVEKRSLHIHASNDALEPSAFVAENGAWIQASS